MSDIYASVGPGMGRRSIGVTSQISLGVGGGGEENAGIAAVSYCGDATVFLGRPSSAHATLIAKSRRSP